MTLTARIEARPLNCHPLAHTLPQPAPTVSKDERALPLDTANDLSERDITYFESWVYFNSESLGSLAEAGVLAQNWYPFDPDNPDELDPTLQFGTMVANGTGIFTAFCIHYLFKRYYKKRNSLNPIYRTFDTLSSFGYAIGDFLGYLPIPFLSGPQRILSTILGCILGFTIGSIGAIFYWLYREFILKKSVLKRNYYQKTGVESWSKYLKTSLVIGNHMGKISGYAYAPSNPSKIYGGGSAVSISAFLLTAIAVPTINYFFKRRLVQQYHFKIMDLEEYVTQETYPPDSYFLIRTHGKSFFKLVIVDHEGVHRHFKPSAIKDLQEAINLNDITKVEIAIASHHYSLAMNRFRHNYIRSGIVIGLAIGVTLGYIASFLIPGLPLVTTPLIFGSCSALLGGIYYGVRGKTITKEVHQDQYTENSWDYANRETGKLGAYIGFLIGLALPVPGGALMGAAFGAALGGAIGWFSGYGVIRAARKIKTKEERATKSSWTMRVAVASGIGATFGAIIGCGIGFAFGGPLGAAAGLGLGVQIGGIIGWVAGVLSDAEAREIICKGIKKLLRRDQAKELTTEVLDKEDECTHTKVKNLMPQKDKEKRSITHSSPQVKGSPRICCPSTSTLSSFLEKRASPVTSNKKHESSICDFDTDCTPVDNFSI